LKPCSKGWSIFMGSTGHFLANNAYNVCRDSSP